MPAHVGHDMVHVVGSDMQLSTHMGSLTPTPAAAGLSSDSTEVTRIAKRKRIATQFEDLHQRYLELRRNTVARSGGGNAHGGTQGQCEGGVLGGGHNTKGQDDAGVDSNTNAKQQGVGRQQRGSGQVVTSVAAAAAAEGAVVEPDGLMEFSRMLSVFANCGTLRVCGVLWGVAWLSVYTYTCVCTSMCTHESMYVYIHVHTTCFPNKTTPSHPLPTKQQQTISTITPTTPPHSHAILSSIEFDRDGETFATGGVSKRIGVYNVRDILGNPNADNHVPAAEIITRSKLTGMSWNPYLKAHLISADYDGVVSLWDINNSKTLMEWEAHDKRIWSVDFCKVDPVAFASGSDDGWVKVCVWGGGCLGCVWGVCACGVSGVCMWCVWYYITFVCDTLCVYTT